MRSDRLRAALLAVVFLLAGGLPALAHRGAWVEQQLRLEKEQRAAREEAATAQLGADLRASLVAESTRLQTANADVFQLLGRGHRRDVERLDDVVAATRSTLAPWPSPALPRRCMARSALTAEDDSAAAPERFRLAWSSKTRYRGINLVGGPQHQPHQQFSCEIASGLFQGAWTDPTTGLSYHRARWYDARTASWLSEDPAGTVDSSNLYAYVGWGPQGATDPEGLRGLPLPAVPPPYLAPPPPGVPGIGWQASARLINGGGAGAAIEGSAWAASGLVTTTFLTAYSAARIGNTVAGGSWDERAQRVMSNNILLLTGNEDALTGTSAPNVLISEGWFAVRDSSGEILRWLPPATGGLAQKALTPEQILSIGQGPLSQEAAAGELSKPEVPKRKRSFGRADREAGFEQSRDAQGTPRCEYCGVQLNPDSGKPESYEADHRDPFALGGESVPGNLAPSCRTCNRSKGKKPLEEWRKQYFEED